MAKLTEQQEQALIAWCESHEHLPKFMRDFHDQKDLFKTIDFMMEKNEWDIDWIKAHVYTIDKFLWFMAKRGYTLQRSRKKDLVFKNVQEDIQARKDYEAEQFRQYLNRNLDRGQS